MHFSIIIIAASCFCLQGCSGDWFNRGAYNSIQESQRQHCYRLIGHQRDDCLARLSTSYDTYKKTTNPDKSEPEN
ncbi:MAG: hypothetical protein KDF58_11100 [Alphaproteobacteria bacterium]|nr:hypothetical protein [Alphaproteobacteria bacterium]HPF46861.1 hypothetical protein [Emcibacteraceae bacterium]HRW28370.1 hypothetical protein [Emcibacteraceae bacterium]